MNQDIVNGSPLLINEDKPAKQQEQKEPPPSLLSLLPFPHIHEIVPGVFAGDYIAAHDLCELNRRNVGLIVRLLPYISLNEVEYPDKFRYLAVDIADADVNIKAALPVCFKAIDNCLGAQKCVFVHCMAGISRTGAVIVGYLMFKYNMTFNKALDFARSKRAIINPNASFVCQLRSMESQWVTPGNEQLPNEP